MVTSLASGWGYVIDIRCTHGQPPEAFIQFANEEAPRWISYAELQHHRRRLLAARAQQPITD